MPHEIIPSAWRNVLPELPEPLLPGLHPETREPIRPDDLAPLFPAALIAQEYATEPWIDVPGEVLDVLRRWRPTPLVRAQRLEHALGTPARIYFKDESVSPTGSHTTNTSIPQAFYNAVEGTTRLVAETRAGRWGSAVSFACSHFDLECTVYMARASHEHEPSPRALMERWGASVVPSPVDDREHPGSLELAISDAVADAVSRADTHYSLGSVLNHALLHQTVIGLEAKEQLQLAGEDGPDVVIGSCRGGSNLGGIALPFVADADVRLVAVEPSSRPTLTEGTFGYDVDTTAGMPALSRYTLGLHDHGVSPIISSLVKSGRMEALAFPHDTTVEAAAQFASTEGMVPTAETGHAVRAVMDEARAAKETGEEPVILFTT